MSGKYKMKAYRLVTGEFAVAERVDCDGTAEDVRKTAATCLEILGRRAERLGIQDWIGIITADEITEDRRVSINMQMAVAA